MPVKRGRLGGLLLLAVLVAFGAFALRFALWEPLALEGDPPDDGYTRLRGVVHVHTTLSDGGGTPEEVIQAARDVGLDFLGITDHNVVDAISYDGVHDGTLVIVGAEISTARGHLLGLGLDEDPVFRFPRGGRGDLEDVRDLGGISFAAHPWSSREDLRWTGWDLPGPWGLELINGDSEFRRAGPRLLLPLLLYRLNPRYALLRGLSSPDEALARWDEMLAQRDVVGLYGADAHSRLPVTRSWALRFPSYQDLFSLMQNHVLLDGPLQGDAEADRRAVLDAVRRGRFYIGLDGLAPADGFSFVVEGGVGERWTMGERVSYRDGLVVRAGGRLPTGASVRLVRDGTTLLEKDGPLDEPLAGPGVYRVEVRVPNWPVPWVLTNPIVVLDADAFAARDQAAAWPLPPPPPAETRLLTDLPGSPAFNPEFDPSSSVRMDPEPADPTGGPEDQPALRLGFRLGEPTEQQAFTWCALVNRQPRDLGEWKGLRFRIRADGVYRVWVQVRDENLASSDDGEEWWLTSVRTSEEWREVLLPFEDLRTINEKTDGRPDPDKTRALVFVLDPAAVKPGTEGTLWIADLGVYR